MLEQSPLALDPPSDPGALLELFALLGAVVFTLDARSLDVRFEGDAARGMVGHRAGVLLSGASFWAESIPLEARPAVFDLFHAVARDGRPRSLEHRLRSPLFGDGWVRTSVMRSAKVPTGETMGLMGAMLDITHSRQNERQWREVEAWLVALGEALPFDFWICDRDGRFVLQNPASVRRLGNALGQSGDTFHDAPGRVVWQRAFDRALAGETVRDELASAWEGARAHRVRLVAPVRELEGIQGVLGVEIDVTELKLIEERLRQSLAELRLTQDALVRKSQLAAVGEMAAVVAHEVRNPLASIGNALALLRRREQDAEELTAELLHVIEEESSRIEWLVANLLEFVRPMAATLELRELRPLLETGLFETLRTENVPESVASELVWDASLPPLLVDCDLFRLALANVLRNAIQAMRGRGRLSVRVDRELDADHRMEWARVTIDDTGPGIAPANLERLFEPFFTTRSTGCGLGLPIVRRVLHEHHGTVTLESTGEGGARCVMRLPIPSLVDG